MVIGRRPVGIEINRRYLFVAFLIDHRIVFIDVLFRQQVLRVSCKRNWTVLALPPKEERALRLSGAFNFSTFVFSALHTLVRISSLVVD